MNARLIQEQVPLESQVKFSLQGGGDISGKLVEIGREHIKIEVEENQPPDVIPLERITYWRSLIETPQNGQSEDPAPASSNTSNAEENSKVDQPKKPDTSTLSSAEIKIEKKLIEIEARFQAKCQNAKIELKEPDFKFPQEDLKDLSDRQRKEATNIWNRIRDKYQYAKKNNELSVTFGRIQPIITELQDLTNRYRSSASIKRHLAYFYTLSGNQEEALKYYQDTAIFSQNETDWYNLAVVAQKAENEELACYSLGQVFQRLPIIHDIEAWYFYVHLLPKFNIHKELGLICQTEHRKISQEETPLLLETGVYLLKTADRETTAKETLKKAIAGKISISSLQKTLNALDLQPTENYQSIAKEISRQMDAWEVFQAVEDQPPQGHIYSYNSHKRYGFIRDEKGTEYFFYITEITDPDLRKELTRFTNEPIPINFQAGQGPKGLKATRISQHRTIHDWYKLAESAADNGDYNVAISHIKRVLLINRNYPNAKESHEKWREYAREIVVPKGSNPFARAKRAQLVEKDLDKAEQFFRQAIAQNENLESAVNDLAWLLSQRERFEDAVKVIKQNRSRIRNQQSLENLLTNIYKKFDVHKAIELLDKQLKQTTTTRKNDQIRWQIASSYLKIDEYVKAEELFRELLKRRPDHVSVKRNIAFCLSRQERYDEAEELLNQILVVSSDTGATALLKAVLQAKQTGEKKLLDEIVIEAELSDYSSGQLSSFTQFFLDRCDFTGVRPDRVQSGKFRRSDINFLEEQATKLRTSRPSERASYYLSAAKIILILEDEDTNRFYRFLARCFASKGDDVVVSNGNLDAAREWYAEALSVYDGDRERNSRGDEQDAVNALVRFLHSRQGRSHIPMPPQKIPLIDDTINEVITLANPQTIFNDITYLVFRSRYAASCLLNRLYDQQDLRTKALSYFKNKGVDIPNSGLSRQKFISLWDALIDRLARKTRELNSILGHFNNFQLTTAWLEHAVEQAQSIVHQLRLDLDKDRIRHLRETLEQAVELCKQNQFEARERLCRQIDNYCRDLLTDIVKGPTRISVEILYPIIENIQTKISEYLKELYVTSKPELTLSMPVEYYSGHDANIEVEIAVENKLECSPAEGLELIVNADNTSFTLTKSEIKLEESLLGGKPHHFIVSLQLTDQTLRSETFSLSAYARYRTSAKVTEETPVENFTIRLYSEDEFTEIINPYNEGPIVSDPEMFYGRDRMIENIANSLQEFQTQNKCVVIYGQKRAGKSSIMFHLRKELETRNLLVLDLGNIGQYLDEHSDVPFSHQIHQLILRSLEEAIEDRIDDGVSSLKISFPSATDFYEHPTPLILFKEVFNNFQRLSSEQTDWQDIQLVLFIDEFSYIYGQIYDKHIPQSFMKNWKALMQANYFNAVLVGQDVMERFIETFQNEFGIAQRERVTYLDREDGKKLIVEPILIRGSEDENRYREPRAIERILELTAGSPFYIQMFCKRLVEHMNLKRAIYVTYSYVEHVKNELMRGRNALGLSNFENLYNSGEVNESKDADVLKILKAIAMHSQTGPCNRSLIDCETKSPIDALLDELVERDVIDREKENYYTIKVGLFKEWLLANG